MSVLEGVCPKKIQKEGLSTHSAISPFSTVTLPFSLYTGTGTRTYPAWYEGQCDERFFPGKEHGRLGGLYLTGCGVYAENRGDRIQDPAATGGVGDADVLLELLKD